ncbi:MAG: recombination mediator RecR [Bacteroidota bacterium]
MHYPSKLLEEAVNQFNQLPGIGKKTALRLALHLLKKDTKEVEFFGNTFINLRSKIQYCNSCHNISETAVCNICSNTKRDTELICVVEDIRDVLAIENTSQFNGVYHVLGGIISPMDGIGPKDLTIDSLIERVKLHSVREIILALSTTMEGDTTNFYIYKKLKDLSVNVSTIARGIAVGDELEYADEVTLGRSILQRTPYEKTISSVR